MREYSRESALAFAARLSRVCPDTVGDNVVSTVLHGSLTLGGFAPGRSDIDLLTVVGDPLDGNQAATLAERMERMEADSPRRVDLRVVTRPTAGSPGRSPILEAGIELRPGRKVQVRRSVEEPDLLVELSIARAHGRTLVGAAPESVIGPVPREWLIEVGDRQLAAWQGLTDDAAHAELMVLTACRIWRFAVEGTHSSKGAAADWALARDPSLTAVEEALRRRTVDPAVTIDPDGVAHALAVVRRQLRGAFRGRPSP
jgi:predicted nucleotidyltransferase